MNTRELVLASGNAGKLKELSAMLAPLGWVVHAQGQWVQTEAVEDGLSFIENALIKARHASHCSDRPALADDSGLVVDALNGEPGIFSARYAGEAGNDAANNQKLLKAMEGVPPGQRDAHFVCAMAFVRHAEDPVPLVVTGRWNGQILEQPRGEGGFGYDPLFLVDGMKRTSAELSPGEKNRLSHRGQALRLMLALLEDA